LAPAAAGGHGHCVAPRASPAGGAALTVVVPPGGLLVRSAQHGPIGIALRRFGPDFAVVLPALGGGAHALAIPADASSRPWQARLDRLTRAPRLCAL
jgi:hypothetical protein